MRRRTVRYSSKSVKDAIDARSALRVAASVALGLFCCLQLVAGQAGQSLFPDVTPRTIAIPLHDATDEDAKAAIAANATIPMWSYSTTSTRGGLTYTRTMVGASPFTSTGTSTRHLLNWYSQGYLKSFGRQRSAVSDQRSASSGQASWTFGD